MLVVAKNLWVPLTACWHRHEPLPRTYPTLPRLKSLDLIPDRWNQQNDNNTINHKIKSNHKMIHIRLIMLSPPPPVPRCRALSHVGKERVRSGRERVAVLSVCRACRAAKDRRKRRREVIKSWERENACGAENQKKTRLHGRLGNSRNGVNAGLIILKCKERRVERKEEG